MTADNANTRFVGADDSVINVMLELNRTFSRAAEVFGMPSALEALSNILIINLAGAYGEETAMAILGRITETAGPVIRQWSDGAAAACHEPGHA